MTWLWDQWVADPCGGKKKKITGVRVTEKVRGKVEAGGDDVGARG